MEWQENTLSSSDGTRLVTGTVPATQIENAPTLVFVHGAFEHYRRFAALAGELAELGFNVLAYDQRGHGKSGGTRMYLSAFEEYLHDLDTVLNAHQQQLQNGFALLGHSMGGLVVLRHRQTRRDTALQPKLTVLSSPFLGVAAPIPAWKKTLSKVVVNVLPKISVPADLDPAFLSHDKAVVAAYRNDPLVQTKATAGWFENILKAQQNALAAAEKTPDPLHILMAGTDKLVSVEATKQFAQKMGRQKTVHLKEYPALYHEIFNETDDRSPVEDLKGLLKAEFF